MMKLPRRVPWASLAELDQVCNWIYSDGGNLKSRELALNRLVAWRAITPLPHALDATLSLLAAEQLDQHHSEAQTQRQYETHALRSTSALAIRQTYATAIVRLVNGLVDPLQLGTYARSIAAIAAQIGLPQWLVELRHAATHEELPSLELLRAATNEALGWLLHNYFLATPSEPSASNSRSSQLQPIAPLLKQYKSIAKIISRDASLEANYAADLTKAIRDIERWVGEARIALSADNMFGFSTTDLDRNDGEDDSERMALNCLCEALLERGALVPVSSKKRLASQSKSRPVLSQTLVNVWSPLLRSLGTNHPHFANALTSAIISALVPRDAKITDDTITKKDLSFELCLAAWAAYVNHRWDTKSGSGTTDVGIPQRTEDVLAELLTSIGARSDGGNAVYGRGAQALLNLLVQEDAQLEAKAKDLLSVARSGPQRLESWEDNDVRVMEERLGTLCSTASPGAYSKGEWPTAVQRAESSPQKTLPVGWKMIDAESWKPCPIGVFVSV